MSVIRNAGGHGQRGWPLPVDVSGAGPGVTLVVWQDDRNFATRQEDIFRQRLAADGSWVGSDFRISGIAATQSDKEPAVVWNGTAGQHLVVWQDGRNWESRGLDTYGRRVDG